MAKIDSKTPLLHQKKPPVSIRPRNPKRRSSFEASTYNSAGQPHSYIKPVVDDSATPGLNLLQMLALTVCMAGVQFTWTVELAYGTPYLISLDLSKQVTALVWLAGPLSGLIVQPLIGAFSDKCTSPLGKRRPFIIGGCILTCISMLGVAYARNIGYQIALWMVTFTQNHDKEYLLQSSHDNAIIVAVASFYFLDFTLNSVQAMCRALILDVPPLWQQDYANAWSARMSNLAMVAGYFVGFIDLLKYLPWLGDSQMKVFCIVAICVFCITISITCLTVKEKPNKLEESDNLPWYHTFLYIWRAFRHLPIPIKTLCHTQFFAWMGWFPFLFYSTQWVSDIYLATHPPKSPDSPIDWAEGTRAGSFALLCYSVISVIAGIIIPALVLKFKRIKLLSLLNVYTLSHILVAATLLSSCIVSSVTTATLVLAIMGIPWAIVLWIPFSLVGEYVSYEDEKRIQNTQTVGTTSSTQLEAQKDEFDAGMILGVHNMYIVFPQFVVAIISSVIFSLFNNTVGADKMLSNVTPVLVFGGLMALVAAGFSRFIVRVT
ncbi:major facilitator superfamily domain-containing protein [Pilobolus umbonatus]|nr:major facilitator superfamily domain-containing protein [Pilobolus umbonatus]